MRMVRCSCVLIVRVPVSLSADRSLMTSVFSGSCGLLTANTAPSASPSCTTVWPWQWRPAYCPPGTQNHTPVWALKHWGIRALGVLDIRSFSGFICCYCRLANIIEWSDLINILERGSAQDPPLRTLTGAITAAQKVLQQRWYFSESLVARGRSVDKPLGLPRGAYATTRGANAWA